MRKDGFAEVDGVRLHYWEWEGGEPTLLLVHGFTANGRMFDPWAESLAPRYKLIAPDLRGRGDSDKPKGPYGAEVHAKDMDLLLTALKIDRVVYIGASMGANIGLTFAVNYPGRIMKLVLGDAGGQGDEAQVAELLKSIQASIARVGVIYPSKDAYWDFWKGNPFFQQMWDKHTESYLEADVEVLPDGRARSKTSKEAIEQEMAAASTSPAFEDLYPKVKCPTLLLRAPCGIFGERDMVLMPEVADRIVRSIPSCRLYNVEGANHYTIFREQPEMMQELVRFIEEE